jgi:aminoglycoside phosphotransferase (APT) family kinase protein
MHSSTKMQVSLANAQAIVNAHFGDAAALLDFKELTEGYFNAAYYLKLNDGRAYVLKIAPPASARILRYERNIMRAEVEVMRLVGSSTSMPVPEVYVYDTSKAHLTSDYFIMAYVPGTPLHTLRASLTDAENAAIDRTLGGYLREMNALHNTTFGYYVGAQFATWRTAFPAMLRGVLDDARAIGTQLPCSCDALYAGMARHFDCLDAVTTPQLVHWDLWDGNIFVDEATRRINGIIDFERALWGDALMEINFLSLAHSVAFHEGYGTAMLDTPNQQERRLLYNVYLFLILLTEHDYRQYESADSTNWAREKLPENLKKLGILAAD